MFSILIMSILIISEPVSYSSHFSSVVRRLSVCQQFDYHVCDQGFLSTHLAEINETLHSSNTTPAVDARGINL